MTADGSAAGGSGEHLFADAMATIVRRPTIFLLGLVQSFFFEGSMYTFVVQQVPTLAGASRGQARRTRFAAFFAQAGVGVCGDDAVSRSGSSDAGMMAVTSVEKGTAVICLVAAAAMMVPIYSSDSSLCWDRFLWWKRVSRLVGAPQRLAPAAYAKRENPRPNPIDTSPAHGRGRRTMLLPGVPIGLFIVSHGHMRAASSIWHLPPTIASDTPRDDGGYNLTCSRSTQSLIPIPIP